jgi:hypothetical protein
MQRPHLVKLALLAVGVCASIIHADALPQPTFHIAFDGTATPNVSAGVSEHVSLKTDDLQYVDGHKGQAVLIGQCPPLVYQASGNIPDEATISLWIKPTDWQSIGAWRYLVSITPVGRQYMTFSHYPKKPPVVQFLWAGQYDPNHMTTERELRMNEWNHVAIAWDGLRSRVYFDGALVLTKPHPDGYQPHIRDRSALQLGGMLAGSATTSGSSYESAPWGAADTAIDELTVYPGVLSATQIAQLAGRTVESRPFAGPAAQPPTMALPRIGKAPTIDGRIEDGEWTGAASLPVLIDGSDPGRSFDYPPMQSYFAWDDTNLYVAAHSIFPLNATVPSGGTRASLADPDEQVWDDESFELWLMPPGGGPRVRFAGNVAGGFTEMRGNDFSWTGDWTYRASVSMDIYGRNHWHAEIAIPLATLGIERGADTEMKMNFCRTWRCLDQLGTTSWAGSPNYPEEAHWGTIQLSPSAIGWTTTNDGSPATGTLAQTFGFHNPLTSDFAGDFSVTLEADVADSDRTVHQAPLKLAAGGSHDVRIDEPINDPAYQRVRYELRDGNGESLLSYSVPFALRAEFLDVIPLLSQDRVVLRPMVTLYAARLKGAGVSMDSIKVDVVDSAGTVIAEQAVTEDGDVMFDLPADGPAGDYRARLYGVDGDGNAIEINERTFHRPPMPAWLAERDDSLDRVLPPFTPLVTETPGDNQVTIRCWGRAYHYDRGLLPTSIETGGIDNVLAGPMQLFIGDQPIAGASITVEKQSDMRDELTVTAADARATLTNAAWIEYDGVIFNEITITAKQDLRDVTLRIPMQAAHARYGHFASGGFGAGGGKTMPLDKPTTSAFYPVVWIGDFERGVAWFMEGMADAATRKAEPIAVTPNDDVTELRVQLVDALAAGETATVRFGLMATPVKPQHPRYPLNQFARTALWDDAPVVPLHATVWWHPYSFFQDILEYDPAKRKMFNPGDVLAEMLRESNTITLPYMTPYTLTSEYPEANHYRREWELIPARHGVVQPRPISPDEKLEWVECWMSPASESYRRFYASRVADTIKRTGLRGIYFDFATAVPDSNIYHGSRGGFPILGLRDFYRRLVNEFVKAGVEDYVIVAHNSQSVQIPALAFVTHFFNGEHLRTASSPTLHEGRDYLDTMPLYWFGIEQSGLPWGIHPNMLSEFDESPQWLRKKGAKFDALTEYLWDRTPSIVMPMLLHGGLPDGYNLSVPYYKSVVATLHQLDVPTATFHPYWRNSDLIEVEGADFKVSAYSRPEQPRVLLVVGNLNREDGEVTVRLDLTDFYDWSDSPLVGMPHVVKKGELMQVVEHIGARDARILDIGPHHVKLWVRGHGMALVEVAGHIRIR